MTPERTNDSKASEAQKLSGYVTSEVLIKFGEQLSPNFSKLRLRILIALNLMPDPIDDIAVTPQVPMFLESAITRLYLVLSSTSLPLSDVRKAAPENIWDVKIIPYPHELRVGDMEEDRSFEAGLKLRALSGAEVKDRDSFQVFVRQSLLPVSPEGRMLAALCASDMAPWPHPATPTIHAIRTVLFAADEQTLAEIWERFESVLEQRDLLVQEFQRWKERAVPNNLAKHHPPASDDAINDIAFEFEMSARPVRWILFRLLICFGACAGTLFASYELYSVHCLIAWMVSAFSWLGCFYVLWHDFRRAIARGRIPPDPLYIITSVLTIIGSYASVYWLLDQTGGNFSVAQGGRGPLDFLYYSAITMSTTGYGDISPLGRIARMLTVSQIILGASYIASVVGISIARMTARADQGSPRRTCYRK